MYLNRLATQGCFVMQNVKKKLKEATANLPFYGHSHLCHKECKVLFCTPVFLWTSYSLRGNAKVKWNPLCPVKSLVQTINLTRRKHF